MTVGVEKTSPNFAQGAIRSAGVLRQVWVSMVGGVRIIDVNALLKWNEVI